MKIFNKFIIGSLIFGSTAMGFQSCSLDEYNPSNSGADATFATPQGMEYLVNQMYYWMRAKYYGREDPALYFEAATDIFQNAATNYTYGMQCTRCTSMQTSGAVTGFWERMYDDVNNANAIINRLKDCQGLSEAQANDFMGEACFIRAYCYWNLVELFGDVEKRTEETAEPNFSAKRTSLLEIYDDIIIPDARKAADLLPIEPYKGNVGRATKKAAQALLARVLLTRASYDKGDTKYYQEAYTEAMKMLKDKATLKKEYGVSLYNTYDEIWQAKNNKSNTEYLWVNSFSSNTTYNADSKPNRLHMYWSNGISGMPGIGTTTSWAYPKVDSRVMPTYYFLQLWEDWDARYASIFKEKYMNGTGDEYWWEDDETRIPNLQLPKEAADLLKDAVVDEKGQVYEITKEVRSDEYKIAKAADGIAVIDINAIYNTAKKTAMGGAPLRISNESYGTMESTADLCKLWPSFTKFRIWDGNPNGTILLGAHNGQFGYADACIMRFAEVPLIAAECAIRLNKPKDAEKIIKEWIRNERVVAPGHDVTEAWVGISDLTGDAGIEWIMEERARELCGEYLRWFDMKRVYGHQGKFAATYKGRNPSMAPDGHKDGDLHQEFNRYWPIPTSFRDKLEDKTGWQNFGYDGYDGYQGYGGSNDPNM